MAYEIIVKANDGRGFGHIMRVANFVGYRPIRDRTLVIVNKDFVVGVPQGVAAFCVDDYGYRVDLDRQRPLLPGSIVRKFDAKKDVYDITEAAATYYKSLASVLNEDVRLFYLDDQNGMEAARLDKVGQVVGERFRSTRSYMPNGRIAIEVETQFLNSPAKLATLKDADYIHLSSDVGFLKAAAKKFSLKASDGTSLDDKVVPMGFPMADWKMRFFDDAQAVREQNRDKLIAQYAAQNCKRFVYCAFGKGEGADTVLNSVYELAKERKDVLFGVDDKDGKLVEVLKKNGHKIVDKGALQKGAYSAEDMPNLCIWVSQSQQHSFDKLAVADATIQGNGSGTTYESMYARVPSINVPLMRPGEEQLLKGMGVVKCGGGNLLLLEDLYRDKAVEQRLTSVGLGKARLDKANLGKAVDDILGNQEKHRDALVGMRDRFSGEERVGKQLLWMSEGLEAEEIRKRSGLGSLN
jgi:hypothetical protein